MGSILRELNADGWVSNENFYREMIMELQDWKDIPLIHSVVARNQPDGLLVRFKGMVQDMHSPEYYFQQIEVCNAKTKEVEVRNGRFRDACEIRENERVSSADCNQSAQRFPLIIISIPGLNDWAKKEEEAINDKALEGYKIPKEIPPKSTDKSPKRSLDDADICDDEMRELALSSNPHSKKVAVAGVGSSEIIEECSDLELSVEYYLNHPLPDISNHTCIFKLYRQATYIRLNDMVEAIGFLSANASLNGKNQFNELLQLESREEILTHNPPPDLIPRLHVIAIKRLEHCNPLMSYKIDQASVLGDGPSSRSLLMNVFTGLFLGDELAAQYMICYLISHVYIRRDTRTIGPLNLNISNVPEAAKIPNYVSRIYEVFSSLVTKSYYMPLSVEHLNSSDFIPRKNLVCNRLDSGILQLTNDTHLFVDESVMQPGKLTENGFHNIAAMVKLMGVQKVEYNYKFFDMELDADYPVCVFSEGKSMLPADCLVPLQPEQAALDMFDATFSAVSQFLKGDQLSTVRCFLTSIKLLRFIMPQDISYVEKDFVSMRADAPSDHPVTEDDLHRHLVIARLVALSRGLDTLDQASWNTARTMEAERVHRVKQMKGKRLVV